MWHHEVDKDDFFLQDKLSIQLLQKRQFPLKVSNEIVMNFPCFLSLKFRWISSHPQQMFLLHLPLTIFAFQQTHHVLNFFSIGSLWYEHTVVLGSRNLGHFYFRFQQGYIFYFLFLFIPGFWKTFHYLHVIISHSSLNSLGIWLFYFLNDLSARFSLQKFISFYLFITGIFLFLPLSYLIFIKIFLIFFSSLMTLTLKVRFFLLFIRNFWSKVFLNVFRILFHSLPELVYLWLQFFSIFNLLLSHLIIFTSVYFFK